MPARRQAEAVPFRKNRITKKALRQQGFFTLDFSCKGVADILRYSPDFTTVTRLRAGKVESEAVLLLVRDGKRAFCYRARNLHVDGRALPLPNADYTGWIDLP